MLDILYEDNHLLVLNKPNALATQPSLHHSDSLEGQAKAWIKEKYAKPGNVYLHAIHRIDAPVSGIVVFAKTSKALSRLQEEMRSRKTHKRYLAWVEGVGLKPAATLKHRMLHGEHRAIEGGDKEAELSYKVLKEFRGLSLVEILLVTGRYHQIRAQFSWIGHPIVGDTKYGSRTAWPLGIALHHREFCIDHPVNREGLRFLAPLPRLGWEEEALSLEARPEPETLQ